MERLDCDACRGTGRDDPMTRHESLTIKPPSCFMCGGRGWVPRVEWAAYPTKQTARIGRCDVEVGPRHYSVSLFGVEQCSRRNLDLPAPLVRAMVTNEAVRADAEYGELWPDD
jgi:hypothetical protein